MPAVINLPFTNYPAGTFVSPEIDTIPINAKGALAIFTRGASGTWPGAGLIVLKLLVEFRYGVEWQPAAASEYIGGQRLNKSGGILLADNLSVQWATIRDIPQIPEAMRVTAKVMEGVEPVTAALGLDSAVSLQWLL